MSNVDESARRLAALAVLELVRPVTDELAARLPELVDQAIREVLDTQRLEPEPYLTIKQASKKSGLSETSLRELCLAWESGETVSGVRCLRLDKNNHRSAIHTTLGWIREWADRQSEPTIAPKREQLRRR